MFKYKKDPAHEEADEKIKKLLKQYNGKVPLAVYEQLRGNSYFWETLAPHLDNEALISMVENYLKNVSYSSARPYRSYDESLLHLIPLLVKRLKEKDECILPE